MMYGFGIDVPTPAGVVTVSPDAASCGSISGTKQMLADLGYDPGPVDSNIANLQFQKAVMAFASSVGINPQGQLGPMLCGPLVQAWSQQAGSEPIPAGGGATTAKEEEGFPTWAIFAGIGVVAVAGVAWYMLK